MDDNTQRPCSKKLAAEFIRYALTHSQIETARLFVEDYMFPLYIEDCVDSLARYFPSIHNDADLSFCVTRLEVTSKVQCFTLRIKSARINSVVQVRFDKNKESISVQV